MKPLIISHADCTDGLTAAWVALRSLGDAEVHFAHHGTDPPDVKGREVHMLDFSYKRRVMERLIFALDSGSLTLLDHHKTAEADLADLPHVERVSMTFDMKHCGARLAFDHFGGRDSGSPVHHAERFVDYVQDRDLWKWQLPDSRLVSTAIDAYPRTFEAWDHLVLRPPEQLADEGRIIEPYRQRCIESACALARLGKIGGHVVPVANTSEMRVASDTAHTLAAGYPFAATYWVRADGIIKFSLRSREEGIDVSEIAVAYGGGGHPHAAGFEMQPEQFADWVLGLTRYAP